MLGEGFQGYEEKYNALSQTEAESEFLTENSPVHLFLDSKPHKTYAAEKIQLSRIND